MSNSTNQNKQATFSQPIRNIQGFLKSFMKTDAAARSLNRHPKLIDKQTLDAKNRVVAWKEATGYNQLAIALKEATDA